MLRIVVMRSELIALVRTVRALSCIEERPCVVPKKPPPMRASDLPIYGTPHADYGEYVESKSVEEMVNYIKAAKQEYINYIKHAVKFLQDKDNENIQYGAIAMGGFAGFLLYGGSFMRRLRYMAAGSLLVSAVCFPNEMEQFVVQSIVIAYKLWCGESDD